MRARPATLEIDGKRVMTLCTVRTLLVHLHFCWDWHISMQKRREILERIQYCGGDDLEDYARSIGASGAFHVYE